MRQTTYRPQWRPAVRTPGVTHFSRRVPSFGFRRQWRLHDSDLKEACAIRAGLWCFQRPDFPTDLSTLPGESSDLRTFRSVCLLHAGALGDCVLAMHVGRAFRAAGCEVTMIARSPIAAWAARRKIIDRFIWLDRVQFLWRAEATEVPSRVSSQSDPLLSSDLVVSFLGGVEELVAQRLDQLCGPERVVHVDPSPREETALAGHHMTRQWTSDILTQLSGKFALPERAISNLSIPPVDRLPRTGEMRADSCSGPPVVLIHPGSGGREKCCPLDPLESVVAELQMRGTRVKWMIGPDEIERDGVELRQRLSRTCEVMLHEAVERAADVVAAAGAFVGNDAGMTHLAALTGIRTVALFGPTDPRMWRPIGPCVHVLPFPENAGQHRAWVATLCDALASDNS